MEESSAMKQMDDKFTLWISTILEELNSGGQVLLHKTNDYKLLPEFFENEMKFRAIRMSDDFRGKIYVTSYDLEDLYNQILKNRTKTSKIKVKKEKEPMEQKEKKESKAPAYKLINEWVKAENTLTKEQIREKLNELGGYEKVSDAYISGQIKNALK